LIRGSIVATTLERGLELLEGNGETGMVQSSFRGCCSCNGNTVEAVDVVLKQGLETLEGDVSSSMASSLSNGS